MNFLDFGHDSNIKLMYLFSVENSYDRHSLPTSRDLGIGLSADFKVDNEIKKPCHKQVSMRNIFVLLNHFILKKKSTGSLFCYEFFQTVLVYFPGLNSQKYWSTFENKFGIHWLMHFWTTNICMALSQLGACSFKAHDKFILFSD